MTTVVNIHINDYDEYIGRGSIFGNPFEVGRDGSREIVILKYEKWFNSVIQDSRFKSELLKLKHKKLGCFCKPNACHGDIIKKYLDTN